MPYININFPTGQRNYFDRDTYKKVKTMTLAEFEEECRAVASLPDGDNELECYLSDVYFHLSLVYAGVRV